MGLDISVYSNLNFVKSSEELEKTDASDEEIDKHHDEYIFVFANPSFAKQADGLVTGFYTGAFVDSFRAGSYSGYNRFRDRLSKLAFDVGSEVVWNNLAAYEGKPFVELINFSDCEGCIGPETSAKLFKDFETFLEKAKNVPTEGPYDYFLDTYTSFMNAFYIASTTKGVVEFH